MWLEYTTVAVIVLLASTCLIYRAYMKLSGKGKGCSCGSVSKGCLHGDHCIFGKIARKKIGNGQE